MPPVSRFGGGKRAEKKQTVVDKLKAFFERFFGIGSSSFSQPHPIDYEFSNSGLAMVADRPGSGENTDKESH